MKEIHFEIDSNEEILDLLDPNIPNIFIHSFDLNRTISWWKTDLKLKNSDVLQDVEVRNMVSDIQTNVEGLKQLIKLNSNYFFIYQFDKPVPDTLTMEKLPEENKFQILKQNGLKHWFFIEFEFIKVGSFDAGFIDNIESNSIFSKRIEERNTGHNNSYKS